MTYAANQQISFRAISGTTRSWNSDAMAAMAIELTAAPLSVPAKLNGRMIRWLQFRLGSSSTNLESLLAAWRAAHPDGLFDPA